uniref:Mediator of RNA polymerase II transcription subunit 20 n=1 Tax=Acrobeloides nanus TaxID=290746 RepID=A0A914CMG4_9BILA
MGVSWVFEVHEEDIKMKIQQSKGREKESKDSAKSIVGWVEIALEQANAVKHGAFKVDCMPYRSNEHVREHIASAFLLHHSNFPESSFTVGVTPEFAPVSRLISDQGFDLILGKFSSILSPDPAGFFEVTGAEYYLKDFRVRVGTAAMNSVTKGVIVEMEYAPSNSPHQCNQLMSEFVEYFFPNQKKPKIFEKPQAELYSAFDTIGQYLEIFVGMRRRA